MEIVKIEALDEDFYEEGEEDIEEIELEDIELEQGKGPAISLRFLHFPKYYWLFLFYKN